MGLFDWLFGTQGATVTSNVVASQPRTSSGGTYTATNQTGQTTQVVSQPVTINQQQQQQAQSPFSDPVGWIGGATNYVGGAIGGGIQGITTIANRTVEAANPVIQRGITTVAQTPMLINTAPAMISVGPVGALPIAAGAFVVSQVSRLITPVQTPREAPMMMSQPQQPQTISRDGITLYTPYGDRAQTKVEGINTILYDPVGGGFAAYDVPAGHSISNIVSSGSSGSLQSGMFSLDALTPVVYTRESAGKVLVPETDKVAAAQVLAAPADYSRLGAEAYGGTVQPLDSRTLESSGAIMGAYPAETRNLASLVSQQGVNLQKTEWTEMPWRITPSASPMIAAIDRTGLVTPVMTVAPAPVAMQQGITSAPARQMNFLEQLNYDVGGFLGIRASGLEQTAAGQPAMLSPTQGMLRPSDFDLWAMQNTGFAAPVLVGLSDFFVGGRTMITESSVAIAGSSVTEAGKPWTTVKEISPGVFETTTFTPSTTTKTGGVLNTIVSTPIPRGFDVGEEQFTKQVMSGLPAMNPAKPTGNVVLDYVAGFGRGAYEGVRTKPLTTLANVGIGLAFVAGGEAIAGLGAGTVAATAGTRLAPLAAGTTFFATKAAPAALMGLYTIDVAGRTTAWGKDFSPAASERFGGIAATEVIPMVAGGMAYRPIATRIQLAEIGYKAALLKGKGDPLARIGEGRVGEAGMGINERATTGRFDYYIKQPISEPLTRTKIDYLAMKQEGFVKSPTEYAKMQLVDRPMNYIKAGFQELPGTTVKVGEGIVNVPTDVLRWGLETKFATTTKFAVAKEKVATDYQNYLWNYEKSQVLTPQQKINTELLGLMDKTGIFHRERLSNILLETGDVVYRQQGHYQYVEPSEGKFQTGLKRLGYEPYTTEFENGVATAYITDYPKTLEVHTHPIGVEFIKSKILYGGKYDPSYLSSMSEGDISYAVRGQSYGENKIYGIVSESGVLTAKVKGTTPEGVLQSMVTRMAYGETSGITVGRNIARGFNTLGLEAKFTTRAELQAALPTKSGILEPNIIGYAQSKLYPSWFEAKTTIPIKAEQALISGEVALWKFGQYAKTPSITIKSLIQERGATVVPTIGNVPKGATTPTIRTQGDTGFGGRMGTKIVGGKSVSGLKPEPSMKSMGTERGSIAEPSKQQMYIQKQDFRNKPLSETMKPWNLEKGQTKQSAGNIAIMTERLPAIDMASPPERVMEPRSVGLFQLQVPQSRTQTEQIFEETTVASSKQRQERMFLQIPAVALASVGMQTFRQVFPTEPALTSKTEQRERQITMISLDVEQQQRQQQIIMQMRSLRNEQVFKQPSESQYRQRYVSEEIQRVAEEPMVTLVPRMDITTATKQATTTQTITEIIPTLEITQRFDITEIPPVFGGGYALGGGGSPSQPGYQRAESWTYKNPVGADIMAKKKGGFRLPKVKKFKGMKPLKF